MTNQTEMFLIGKIVNTHGTTGEVKVKQISDFDERFTPGAIVYVIDQNDALTQLTIESARRHKNHLLLRFENYRSLQSAEPFKGLSLMIKREQLTELKEHEYYYYEIIGCLVTTTDGVEIGVVDSILSPGANDVWVVKNKQGKEYLIPYIADVVKEVDVSEKKIIIEVMEGLLD